MHRHLGTNRGAAGRVASTVQRSARRRRAGASNSVATRVHACRSLPPCVTHARARPCAAPIAKREGCVVSIASLARQSSGWVPAERCCWLGRAATLFSAALGRSNPDRRRAMVLEASSRRLRAAERRHRRDGGGRSGGRAFCGACGVLALLAGAAASALLALSTGVAELPGLLPEGLPEAIKVRGGRRKHTRTHAHVERMPPAQCLRAHGGCRSCTHRASPSEPVLGALAGPAPTLGLCIRVPGEGLAV